HRRLGADLGRTLKDCHSTARVPPEGLGRAGHNGDDPGAVREGALLHEVENAEEHLGDVDPLQGDAMAVREGGYETVEGGRPIGEAAEVVVALDVPVAQPGAERRDLELLDLVGEELAALQGREPEGTLTGCQAASDAGERATGPDRAADHVELEVDLDRDVS